MLHFIQPGYFGPLGGFNNEVDCTACKLMPHLLFYSWYLYYTNQQNGENSSKYVATFIFTKLIRNVSRSSHKTLKLYGEIFTQICISKVAKIC